MYSANFIRHLQENKGNNFKAKGISSGKEELMSYSGFPFVLAMCNTVSIRDKTDVIRRLSFEDWAEMEVSLTGRRNVSLGSL